MSTKTAADGTYALAVKMCRPAGLQRELRPVTVEAEGCESATVQSALGASPLDFDLPCGGG